MQGLDDDVPPGLGVESGPSLYNALPLSMTNKVLVQIGCATHTFMNEGCTDAARCMPSAGVPYGGVAGQPWEGAHSTIKAALIEWITSTTFNGAASGNSL